MNLPNLLSLLRILSVPVLIWLVIENHLTAALVVFACSGLTDALDGYLAKRWHQETELGRHLDPLADKLLLLSGYITLTVLGLLPLWLTLLVVTRDVVIIGGAVIYQMMTGTLRIEPLWISKWNTVNQMVLLFWVLYTAEGHFATLWLDLLIGLTALTTCLSGGSYVLRWSRYAAEQERIKQA
ncbi:MAG: CDP-diacylglycerol--glycerol-3-phosphate 3-phosphatidyltransferase [Magnetococcales bacterium]|nr:CDP-diacylglycerol--glycerol-3-phosphate 3-phosphatidyltransferase [Magnetococcales bacterium]MBF0113861.1 CDP-diacylglycerol--glycerol-3-phosphate 3-phosphatidyltransferase [Magnetococcales bacterium]